MDESDGIQKRLAYSLQTVTDGTDERMTISVVVLSQGTRPVELARAFDGLAAQRGVVLDIVCVGNGWTPTGLPVGVHSIALPANVGITKGRNAGADGATGELIFFPDDDAWIADPWLLERIAVQFAADPRLAAVQPRIADIDGTTLRRWVPRARVGEPTASGPAFNLLEGVAVFRRSAFEAVGRWPDEFFYGHEGVDLAWRLWGAGLPLSLRRRPRHPPSGHRRHSARRVLPVQRAEPGLDRAAQPAVAGRVRLSDALDGAHRSPPDHEAGGPADLGARIRRGLAHVARPAPPDAVEDGLATDLAGPTAESSSPAIPCGPKMGQSVRRRDIRTAARCPAAVNRANGPATITQARETWCPPANASIEADGEADERELDGHERAVERQHLELAPYPGQAGGPNGRDRRVLGQQGQPGVARGRCG